MDARSVFLTSYAGMTSGVLGGDRLLNDLTDEQLRARPLKQANSIAWVLWHIVRCEDATVNRMIVDCPQVFDGDNWPQRLNVLRRDIGTGMTNQEVTELSEQIDLAMFRDYRVAVTERTRQVVESLPPSTWDDSVTAAHAKRVALEDGMLAHAEGWVDRWSTERPKGSWLFSHVINHSYRHLGEAFTIRGVLGVPQIA